MEFQDHSCQKLWNYI